MTFTESPIMQENQESSLLNNLEPFNPNSEKLAEIRDDEAREKSAEERGLPEDATWGDINSHDSEESRKKFAEERGLPEDATWGDINSHDSEESRKKSAEERGLPEDATWGDINSHDSRKKDIDSSI